MGLVRQVALHSPSGTAMGRQHAGARSCGVGTWQRWRHVAAAQLLAVGSVVGSAGAAGGGSGRTRISAALPLAVRVTAAFGPSLCTKRTSWFPCPACSHTCDAMLHLLFASRYVWYAISGCGTGTASRYCTPLASLFSSVLAGKCIPVAYRYPTRPHAGRPLVRQWCCGYLLTPLSG